MTPANAVAPSGDAATAIATRLGDLADDSTAACAEHAVGGVVPALVARPRACEEIGAVVGAVAGAGGALVALGRGAHRDLGHAPARYDLALATGRLTRVIDYTPADMTVTVEAGLTIAELAAMLAREKQWLPLEPPLPAATTVGGLLATDRSGLLAATEGRVRDFVIGVGAVTATGTTVRAGGRVVKNVAGYDLMKLFVGSLGTLAVLAEATFKVRPLPESQHVIALPVASISAALVLGRSVERALAVVAHGPCGAMPASLVVRLGGSAPDVAADRRRVIAMAAREGGVVEHDASADEPAVAAQLAALRDFPLTVAADLVVRLAALPNRLGELATAALGAVGSRATWRADVARGVLVLAVACDGADEATALLASLAQVADGCAARLVVERWPAALASSVAVWHPRPAALPLMRRMKTILDPAGVLAPGRYVERL